MKNISFVIHGQIFPFSTMNPQKKILILPNMSELIEKEDVFDEEE